MRAGPWPTANIQPPISRRGSRPNRPARDLAGAVSTCPGTGARNAAAVKMRHRQCHDFTNWPVKTGPAARAGPAARSAAAQRRAGICRTAPGAASLTATMMASPAKHLLRDFRSGRPGIDRAGRVILDPDRPPAPCPVATMPALAAGAGSGTSPFGRLGYISDRREARDQGLSQRRVDGRPADPRDRLRPVGIRFTLNLAGQIRTIERKSSFRRFPKQNQYGEGSLEFGGQR